MFIDACAFSRQPFPLLTFGMLDNYVSKNIFTEVLLIAGAYLVKISIMNESGSLVELLKYIIYG